MNFTEIYALLHSALARASVDGGLRGTDIRVLLAIHDRGGDASSADVEQDTMMPGAAVRRSSLALRSRGLIRADAGAGTTVTSTGVRARYVLAPEGKDLVARVLRDVKDRGGQW